MAWPPDPEAIAGADGVCAGRDRGRVVVGNRHEFFLWIVHGERPWTLVASKTKSTDPIPQTSTPASTGANHTWAGLVKIVPEPTAEQMELYANVEAALELLFHEGRAISADAVKAIVTTPTRPEIPALKALPVDLFAYDTLLTDETRFAEVGMWLQRANRRLRENSRWRFSCARSSSLHSHATARKSRKRPSARGGPSASICTTSPSSS